MAYSSNFRTTMEAGADYVLTFITITFGDGSQIKIVNNNEDINGFTGTAFEVQKPTQPDSGVPTSNIVISNIGTQLSQTITSSTNLEGTKVKFEHALLSSPTTIEWSIELNLTNITVSANSISGRLSFTDVYNKPVLTQYYDQWTAPGLL